MPTADQLRSMALALPETAELPHHGFPSWRVRGKIFATLPDAAHVHLMLDPEAIREAVLLDPASCTEKWWGDKLSAVRVELALIAVDALQALVVSAWSRKAPASLRRP